MKDIILTKEDFKLFDQDDQFGFFTMKMAGPQKTQTMSLIQM